MDGLLIVDKPSGPTSHDVVARMRRALGEKRIGHTGTLDPMATGVLLLVVGKATRLAKFLSGSDKSYDAIVRLGFATDTADAQGRPLGPVSDRLMSSRTEVEAALDAFRGTFMQQPPAFSAKKIDGQRSYTLARHARLSPPRRSPAPPALPAPVRVTTHRLEILAIGAETVTLQVDCSAGFYVRSLAHDLGERLGVGAHLTALRRTRIGDFGLDAAVDLEAAERDPAGAISAMLSLACMLPRLAAIVLTAEGVHRVGRGQDVRPIDHEPSRLRVLVDAAIDGAARQDADGATAAALGHPPFLRLLDQAGALVAIAEPAAAGLLHPSVVLV